MIKFKYYKTLSKFNADSANNIIKSDDIVFIEDDLSLRTHGKTYGSGTPYSNATTSTAGLMSSTDKSKLDGIASGATANTGTITGITMNGSSKGTSGVVDLGTVITSHQDISGKINTSEKGANNGVATLDSSGKVPSSQLPSYVDDVIEYSAKSSFPSTGEGGKIYVDTSNNTTWRWSGSAYTQIKGDLTIGTTSGTAYDGASGAALKTKLDGIESGALVHKAPTSTEVKTALGTGSGTSKYLREDGTWLVPPDNNSWRPLGTTADTACAGNDSRLSDARPASDVYSWAKASSKPSYSWSEIGSKPSFATVATSGSYNDLSNKPTIPTNNNQLTNGAGYITGLSWEEYN